jgi:hypothetical protein
MKAGDLVIPMYGVWEGLGIVTSIDNDSKYCSVCFAMEAGRIVPFLCAQLEIINESR